MREMAMLQQLSSLAVVKLFDTTILRVTISLSAGADLAAFVLQF